MTTLDDLFPSNYLKSSAVAEADLVLTISRIDKEKMTNKEGKEEVKPVLYFKETEKGIVLNKTNATTISRLYPGPIEGWIGQKIALSSETVTAFGETKEALRVRTRIPALAAPTEVWTYAQAVAKCDEAGIPQDSLNAYLKEKGLAGYSASRDTGLVQDLIASVLNAEQPL